MISNLNDNYSSDNLVITRSWQDVNFFQIDIECKSKHICVREKVYTSDELIDDLYNKLNLFLSENNTYTCWQNGTNGDETTPCVELRFSYKDSLGHVLIEVYIEIDDGGIMGTHNCCFYLNTEIGLLYQFKEDLLKLKTSQLGVQIMLNRSAFT